MNRPETVPVRSILLSKAMILLFALALAALDVGIWPLTKLFQSLPFWSPNHTLTLTICLYLCNLPGFGLLATMWQLLTRLGQRAVFVPENVKSLTVIQFCCFTACLICLGGTFVLPTLFILVLATAFMGLVVRIVRQVFRQAIPMQDELDLTV